MSKLFQFVKYGTAFCLCLVFNNLAKAQPLPPISNPQWVISTRELGIADGLDRERILECFQDTAGFYWLAAENGFYRFDGQRFKRYTFQALGIAEAQALVQLRQDVDGQLWIIKRSNQLQSGYFPLSRQGKEAIYRFNTHTGEVTTFIDMRLGKAGTVWEPVWAPSGFFLVRNGHELFELREAALHPVLSLSSGQHIESIYCTADRSAYYLQNTKGEIYHYQTQSKTSRRLPINEPITRMIGSEHHLLLEVANSHLRSYNLRTGKQSVLRASHGKVIISYDISPSGESVYRIGDELFVFQDEAAQVKLKYTLALSDVLHPAQYLQSAHILDGRLWLSLYNSLLILSAQPSYFSNPQLGQLNKASVRAICPASGDSLMVNSYSGTLICQREPFSCRKLPGRGIEGSKGFGLWPQQQRIYSGEHGAELVAYDQSSGQTTIFPLEAPLSESVPSVLVPFVTKEGDVWAGLGTGMARLKDQKQLTILSPEQIGSLYNATVNLATPLADSIRFWIASTKGLFLLDTNQGVVVDSVGLFQDREIAHVLPLTDGGMWVSCSTGPVYKLDAQFAVVDSFQVYKEGLKNTIHACLPDAYGAFWIPTDDGLYRYDTLTRNITRFSKESDALPFNEFNKLAWMQASDSTLWLGGTQGIVHFDPANFKMPFAAPQKNSKVRITELALLDDEDWLDVIADANYFNERSQTYVFPAKVKTLRLYFADFSPDINGKTYYYRFSDEDNWLSLDQSQLLLSNATKGKYQIQVAIRNPRRNTFQTATIALHLLPPWYLRAYSIPLWLGLFVLLLWLVIRLRTQRVRAKNRELQLLVAARTKTIAQDKVLIETQNEHLQELLLVRDKLFAALGHELQHPLNKLNRLSEKAAYLLKNQELEALHELSQQISVDAIQSRLLLDNLLGWGKTMLSNQTSLPQDIPVYYVVQDTIALFEQMITDKDLVLRNDLPQALHIHFDRFALTTILRNLIHNAIKFSPIGGTITISNQPQKPSGETLVVADEGIGLPTDFEPGQTMTSQAGTQGEKGAGFGLHLCMSLAQQNRAQLIFASNLPQGVLACIQLNN